MTVFLVTLETGIALASAYLLTAVSFTLVLAVSGVFNFLQASVVMLATVFTFELIVHYSWSTYAALAVLLVFGLIAGYLAHLLTVRPAVRRSRDLTETTLLTTIGASTAVNAIAGLAFGSDTHPVPGYVSALPLHIGSIPINKTYIVILATVGFISIAFVLVLRRTEMGRVTRATLEDPGGARIMGIDTGKVIVIAFCVAGLLAVVAGWLLAPVISASAYSAQNLAFYAFAAMAIGGFGSFGGAMLGAGVVGLAAAFVPAYMNPDWADPIILLLVAALLVMRPAGILGTKGLFGSASEREI